MTARAATVMSLAGAMRDAREGAAVFGADRIERALDRCAAAEGRDWRGWRQRRKAGLETATAGDMTRALERVWREAER